MTTPAPTGEFLETAQALVHGFEEARKERIEQLRAALGKVGVQG